METNLSEIKQLKNQVGEISLDVSRLTTSVENLEQQSAEEDDFEFTAVATPEAENSHDALPPGHPFEINWDATEAAWDIFLPDGCVMVGDQEATYNGERVDGVASLSPVSAMYCHVYKTGGAWKFKINGSKTDSNAKYSFPVANFDDDLSEVIAQHVSSVVSLGSGDGDVEVDDKSVDWRTDAEAAGGDSSAEESGGSEESSSGSGDGASSGSGGSSDDSTTVERKSLEIKGWKTQQSAANSLVTTLGLPAKGAEEESEGGGESTPAPGSDKQIIIRNGVDGSLEYMDLGAVDINEITGQIDTVGDGTLAITYTDPEFGVISKRFTANQFSDTSVTIPAPGNGTITIQQGGTNIDSFTVNQSTNKTIALPAAPTVNNGTLTIKQGSTTLGTFTANQSTASTVTIPAAPTVNDGTLTIKQGSTTLGTFTANQATASTVTIPTVDSQVSVYDNNPTLAWSTQSKVATIAGTDIHVTMPADPTAQMPTVNDGTLTIKQGSTTLGTFTANQSTASTVTIPAAPTVNDGTLTIKQGSTTLGTFTANQASNSEITIPAGPSGSMVVLRKTKYDTSTKKVMAAYSKINLATGAVTAPSASEIPADNDATLLWAEVAEAVPHSSASAAE